MRNVLIIGAGGIGKRHIRGFLKTGAAKVSIVEPDPSKRAEVLRTYPLERGYADLKEVDLTACDLAVICAPAHVHVPLGQACAEAGRHFLLEKPLSVSMEGVDRLLDTVRRNGVTARVGYIRRSAPEFVEMRKQALGGRIGELRMAYINMSQEYPKYRPDYRDIYYAKKATGGGAVLDAASHVIDFLQWFLGPVSEVSAMYDHLQLPGVEVEDACLIALRFRNGCMAQININQFQKPNTSLVELIGSRGNLQLEGTALKFSDNDSGRWDASEFMDGMSLPEAHEARFRLQAERFMAACEGQPDNLTTLDQARDNLRVALAAKDSYLTKRIIQL
jgi:predicted dehydrogenase